MAGDQPLQIVRRTGLHAGGDLLREEFEQLVGHGRRLSQIVCWSGRVLHARCAKGERLQFRRTTQVPPMCRMRPQSRRAALRLPTPMRADQNRRPPRRERTTMAPRLPTTRRSRARARNR